MKKNWFKENKKCLNKTHASKENEMSEEIPQGVEWSKDTGESEEDSENLPS